MLHCLEQNKTTYDFFLIFKKTSLIEATMVEQDIRQFNLLYLTTKITFNKETKAKFLIFLVPKQ